MNLISVAFIVFLPCLFFLYFIFPLQVRWLVLLAGSCIFYAWSGWEAYSFVIAAWIVTYGCSRMLSVLYQNAGMTEKKTASNVKKRARWILLPGILMLLGMLIYSKMAEQIADAVSSILQGHPLTLPVIIPLGISYYTFSAIGYLADVYWKKDPAEKNPLKLFLFLLYFPHITQGPIPKHRKLAGELTEGHRFEYDRVCFGVQRIIWGYFKKLVIADRFAVIVRAVLGNDRNYEGLLLLLGIMASAVQLYTDFSGCMDIALGISEVLGIPLDENFRRPFFAKSAAEFWRRWHITLGTWFKDYVYMPIVVSPWLLKLTNASRKRLGKRFARNLMTVIPLAVVWFLTGLWHGTGADYIAWGIWWGSIIILSTIFSPELKKLTERLHIDSTSVYYHIFQMLRTFLIFCVGRLLTAPGDLSRSCEIVGRIFGKWNPWIFFDGTLYRLGLDRYDFWLGILSLLLLWFISLQQEKGVQIRRKIAACPLAIRWMIYLGAIFAVLTFGMYGVGHDPGAFIYTRY